jgi:hypothetical protein
MGLKLAKSLKIPDQQQVDHLERKKGYTLHEVVRATLLKYKSLSWHGLGYQGVSDITK